MASPMRLGINARSLSDPKIRGFTRHLLELLRALRQLAPELEVHLFTDRAIAPGHLESLAGCRIHLSDARPHLFWEQAILPFEAIRHHIDVFHAPANLGVPGILAEKVPCVVTLHDMISVRDVRRSAGVFGLAGGKGALSFRLSWKMVGFADAIVTVSQHSRLEILKERPEWESRLHVIPNGVESRFTPGPGSAEVQARYGLRHPYLLYVGGFEERKNLGTLLDAFGQVETTGAGRIQLALAGDPASAAPALKKRLDSLSNGVRLGYVPETDLAALYRGARCSVVPSRDEGFGLQVLESMSCGTPVLASSATSLPEAGGDAAAYFAPDDAPALAALIERVLKDEVWVSRLSDRGIRRARDFSWENTAKSTLALYRELRLRRRWKEKKE